MATIDLGKLGFVNKGTYSSSTSYEKNDLVQYTDSGILSTYLYINASAATGQTPSTSGTVNGTYWAYYAKGAAAYSSTLTTQGDILYHNGSGEARLGAGTSGQVLQTGGSGANPSWTTMSSDVVKLASGSFSTSSDNLVIDGFTNSIYKSYKLILQSASTNNSGNSVRLRFRNGSSDLTSEYLRAGHYTGINSSGNSTGSFNNISSYNQDHYPFGHHGNANGDLNFAELVFNELTSTTAYKIIHSRSLGKDGSSQWTNWVVAGMYRYNADAVTGIKIFTGSGGNFTITGNYELYGFKA